MMTRLIINSQECRKRADPGGLAARAVVQSERRRGGRTVSAEMLGGPNEGGACWGGPDVEHFVAHYLQKSLRIYL